MREELVVVEAEIVTIETERQRIGARKATLAGEIADLPGDAALRAAHAHVTSLAKEHERLASRQAKAATKVQEATAAEEAARDVLAEAARDADLPAKPAELSDVDNALGEYRISLGTLWPAVQKLRDAERLATQVAEDLERVRETAEKLAERAAETAREAEAAAERLQTLRDTVGAAVAELERRLAEVAELLDDNESARSNASKDANRAIEARGEANGRRKELIEKLEEATEERAAATDAFRRFAATGLLTVALPELDVPDPDGT